MNGKVLCALELLDSSSSSDEDIILYALNNRKLKKGLPKVKNYIEDVVMHYTGEEDTELECLQLEAKITDMEDEKETLSREIVEANRDMLAWETKVKLAQETKTSIVNERGVKGEVGAMKAEIHRMTVRFSQLRKAQEKLVHDLNHCVSRREFIYVNAEATEKRLALTGNVNNRINFMKKLENAKLKLKKTEEARKDAEIKIQYAQDLEVQFYDKINENDRTISDMETKIIELMDSIETAKFERQKELETLVYVQHKFRAFTSISKRQYKQNYNTQTLMQQQFAQELEKNSNLRSVIESLILSFPNHYPEFTKILNTLNIVREN